jgi:hypothetical protein
VSDFIDKYPNAEIYRAAYSAYGDGLSWYVLGDEERQFWTLRWTEAQELNKPKPEGPAPDVDLVNNPPHYTNGPKCPGCGRTIECIDITRWLPFNPGNSIKYLWRRYFGGKAGEDAIEPVRKARWYLNDEVERLEEQS